MRYFQLFIYSLAILLLQTTLIPRWAIFGVFPDLVLIVIVIYSINRPLEKALAFALIMGFAQDLFGFGGYTNALVKAIVCGGVFLLREKFSGDTGLLITGMIAGSTVFVSLLLAFYHYYFFASPVAWGWELSSSLVRVVYNLFMTMVILTFSKKVLLSDEQE